MKEISGQKIWEDNDNEKNLRPESITIQLLADEQIIDSVILNEETGMEFTFKDLPTYNELGELIEYSLHELAVEGYSVTYDGFDVINTLNEEPPKESGTEPTDNKRNRLVSTGERRNIYYPMLLLLSGGMMIVLKRKKKETMK